MPDVDVLDGRGGTRSISHVQWLTDCVRADESFGVGDKAELGASIIDKLASAKGHAFLTDEEHAALVAAYRLFHTLTDIAIAGARAGWQRAVREAEEFVEQDGQLVKRLARREEAQP